MVIDGLGKRTDHAAAGVCRRGVPRIVAAVALCLAAASCANETWVKPGASRDDYNRDAGQCTMEARDMARGYRESPALFFEPCMQRRGWTLQSQ
jgi:hypothetical protein